jgi:hypothetical protein
MGYISYIIFGLVKTNAIINESAFLTGFFSVIEYIKAKEFIVFNYSLFTNTEFLERQFMLDDSKPRLEGNANDLN